MGEVKSTLELVMEKTRNLNLSQEEREEQRNIEIKARAKSLLQKYQDKILSKEQFTDELDALEKAYSLGVKNNLINEIVDRLNLDEDISMLLVLLEDRFGLEITEIESLFTDYQKAIASGMQERITQIKEDLTKKHFISGPAISPNLEVDEVWKAEVKKIKNRFDQILGQEKDRLKRGG